MSRGTSICKSVLLTFRIYVCYMYSIWEDQFRDCISCRNFGLSHHHEYILNSLATGMCLISFEKSFTHRNEYWSMWWLGAAKQQVINGASDGHVLWRHMARTKDNRFFLWNYNQCRLWYTVMSLWEAPSIIEAPPSESASCHGIVAPPQIRSAGRL